jgi:4-hydroxy-tetrahydrodipicolinate reductase
MMNQFPDYDSSMEEIHHIHKLDEPSGTAITLAEGILENLDRKGEWKLGNKSEANTLPIVSKREGEVPGTHIIRYASPIDTIEISHEAHNRKGFATGAVLAAEFIKDKQGVYGMDDMLNF